MGELTLGRVLLYAVIAGLAAGLLVAGFHMIVTEQVIDQAVALEEQAAPAPAHDSAAHEKPIVSRDFQKTGGLLIGYLFYGLTCALFFSLAFYPLQGWLMRFGAWRGPLLLAMLTFWAVVLVPFLKYPANPPAVGDPATIDYRQNLYLTLLLLSIAGTALAVWFGKRLALEWKAPAWLVTGGLLIVVGMGLVLLLPSNPDSITAPLELVFNFRVRALLGLTLFWGMFGGCFAWLVRRSVGRKVMTAVST